jgi:hypothetical protein
MAAEHRPLTVRWRGKDYAVPSSRFANVCPFFGVEIPPVPEPVDAKALTTWRAEAGHCGREALEAALPYWNPVGQESVSFATWVASPPSPAVPIPRLSVWQRAKHVASAIVRACLGAGTPLHERLTRRDAVQFRREILTRWWRHEGNGAVVRHAGGPEKTARVADLIHATRWQEFRDADYRKARQQVHAAERLLREIVAHTPEAARV